AAQAVRATHGTDQAKIISYLHSGVTLNSVQGPVQFNSLQMKMKPVVFVFQWQDGNYAQVLPVGAAGSGKILFPKPSWGGCPTARRTEQQEAEMGRELSRAIIDGILVGGVYALMAV